MNLSFDSSSLITEDATLLHVCNNGAQRAKSIAVKVMRFDVKARSGVFTAVKCEGVNNWRGSRVTTPPPVSVTSPVPDLPLSFPQLYDYFLLHLIRALVKKAVAKTIASTAKAVSLSELPVLAQRHSLNSRTFSGLPKLHLYDPCFCKPVLESSKPLLQY